MTRVARRRVKGGLPALALLAAAPAPAAQGIEVGQVIASQPGQVLNSWTHLSEGYWSDGAGRECCYILFRRGPDYLLARTEPVVRGGGGGAKSERVAALKMMTKRAGEMELQTCSFRSLSSPLAFYDRKSKLLRGAFIGREEIQIWRWYLDDQSYCDFGD